MRLISEALRDLRSHRGRSLLSALSLFVGVVAIVGVYTAGSIVKEVFVADAEQLHGRAITVSTRIPGGTMAARGLPATLTELKRQITAAGGSYALATDATAQVHGLGGKPESQTVALVAGRLDKVRRLPIIQGRWLPPDSRAFPGGLVLNMAARNVYGGVGTRLSVQLDAGFEPYQQTVIGVVSDGLNGPMIYQSLPAALAYQPGVLPAGWSPQLLVHAPSVNEGVLRDAVRTVVADLGSTPASWMSNGPTPSDNSSETYTPHSGHSSASQPLLSWSPPSACSTSASPRFVTAPENSPSAGQPKLPEVASSLSCCCLPCCWACWPQPLPSPPPWR